MDLRIIKTPKTSHLADPEKGLRALAKHAPKAEAFAERVVDRVRPYAVRLHHARRRIATAGVFAVTAWLFIHVMFGANGMVVYRQKKTEYQVLQKEVENLQKENDSATDEVKALKEDPKTIEKEAREQLHYAKPGEIIYVAPAPVPRQNPNTNSARK
jgi:cell division protein FtsB